MSRSLFLVSGGMDSTAMLHMYGNTERDLCLFFNYGQPQVKEELGQVLDIGAALHTMRITLPQSDRWIYPARNAVFLSVAWSVAMDRGCDAIYIGACADDQEYFPDCRQEFFDAAQEALAIGTGAGITIKDPLLGVSKEKIAAYLNKHMLESWSCYKPDGMNTHCGQCPACLKRTAAFEAAGIGSDNDPG